ncbi:cytosolic beta-glucosidase-like [Branchiostoma lanceolatum]|uniref:cytosolic beta-glucosidase-like n=1 Tax=Branchiostoma lanceolatum TaxID=7740 RepID=UPI003454C33B
MKWVVLLVFLFWSAGLCSALGPCWLFGAPESACVDMMPGGWSGPQDPPSPYNIQVTYIPDSHSFNVRVAGDQFRAVLLQARRPGSTEPVGTFHPPQFSDLKLLTCSAPGDSVTNSLPIMKTEVEVTWAPPSQTNLGSIYFVSTVMNSCRNYWVGVQSEPLSELTRDIFWPGTVPDGYLWSTATASYQIEGAWNVDGKGESMWDRFQHNNGRFAGDDACKSYDYYARDVEMSDELGLNAYRFSLSWTRILPDGTVAGGINQAGIDYYNNLINELLINGKTPYVTLYHWDGPQTFQDQFGGWVNEAIVDYFNDYARVCYQAFGDRVKHWVTFNEPWSFVVGGYGIAGGAPGIWDANKTEQYKAAHNAIRAHARAWHTYDEEFRADQQGSCGIVIGSLWSEPLDPNNPQDVLGSYLYQQFFMGWFANPIFGNGNYPQEMIDIIAANSQREGWPQSRLPVFTEEEILYNRGTADFVGLNQYSARLIYASNDTSPVDPNGWFNWMSIMIPDLLGYRETIDPSWPQGEMIFLLVTPWCVRRQLDYFRSEYQYDGPFYLTETGISEAEFEQPNFEDIWRTCYYTLYTNEVVKAVELDGVDHRGFFAWTLMDNVEWGSETHERFGLFYTNFSDPARTRTPKDSVASYRDIATTNGFPVGAPHTETARAIWDWCLTKEPYEGTSPQAATFNTGGIRQADPTVDYFLPGVRVGAAYRDKVVN